MSDPIPQNPTPTPVETTPVMPTTEDLEGTNKPRSRFGLKSGSRLPYIMGGIFAILISLALGITFFGNKKTTPTSVTNSENKAEETIPGYTTYTNTPYFYSLGIPPSWSVVENSPDQSGSTIIQTDAPAIVTITSQKATTASLDEYFATFQDGRKASSTSPVKVGQYDAIERVESWPKTTLEPVITYAKIQDQLYVFSLLPAQGKNAITSQSLLKDYRTMLSTFKLTTTTELGQDWMPYQSTKVDGLTFPTFNFTHPQSWAVSEKSENKNLTVSIYRNNYEIAITQAAVGGAVCLFKDSPDFSGSSGDLRTKDYTEFETKTSLIMRRYFNSNQGEKSTFYFCQKEDNSPYFSTPTQVGGIVYYVPAKYDTNIIDEMDEIIKTLTVNSATDSATNP